MAEIYTYSFAAFGSNELNRLLFAAECQASLGQKPYQFVDDGTNVQIYFQTAVNVTSLNAVVTAHNGIFERPWVHVFQDPVIEPVIPQASKVLANDRPAIEIQDAVTGFGTIWAVWPLAQNVDRLLQVRIKFILKTAGTGSNVRLAARLKAQAKGEDSSAGWAVAGVVVVPITFTTIGEVFEGELRLNASSMKQGDAVALQIGRDGAEEISGGAADDVDQAIQIIAVEAETA